MNFVYHCPIKLMFGSGMLDQIGKEADIIGSNVLIVTGGNSTKKTGLLDRCVKLLEDEGLDVTIFDKVQQNPITSTVMEGAELSRAKNIDLVIGLGGGSSIDCAKAIAFAATNDGDVSEYVLGKPAMAEALPIIAVPTTCGTGTEGNGFAILTDTEKNNKKGLVNPSLRPTVSIIDPILMMTMPKNIAETVIFDAFCHCMEGRLSSTSNEMSRMMDEEGMRRIYASGKIACNDPKNIEAWESVSFASTLGGLSLASGGSVAPHGVEHPLSGLYNIVHGRGLAAISKNIYAMAIEKGAGLDKFAAVSRCIGGQDSSDFVKQLEALQDSLNMNVKLSEEGMKEEDIPWLVENCMQNGKGNLAHHPIPLSREDLAEIYRRSM